jgi:phytoene dehydrogenase-like protein
MSERTPASTSGPAAGAEPAPVVVVGAGLAGLVCAISLHEVGQSVLLLEASDGVGGRVRSDRHPDGFVLDRGFQVLLDAYPAARRWIDHPALRPLPFDAGAIVWTGRRLAPLADPFRHPSAILRDVVSPVFGLADKARLVKFGAHALRASWQSAAEAAADGPETSAAEALCAAGFSPHFVDRFARPFWGGILLDPALSQSSGPLRFTLKMFLQGRAVLPADGVGEMAAQLALRLPPERIRLRAAVASLIREAGAIRGVRISAGEEIRASAVVVATDPPAARALTGIASLPDATLGLGSLTVFLAGERDPGTGPRLVLNGTPRGPVNHLAPLSAAQPAYAPPGQHLLAAVVVGDRMSGDGDDERLAIRVREDAATMIGHDPDDWRVLRVDRIPFSQFAQPPGIYGRLPNATTSETGLYLAGEATVDSSYNGAILSGEAAARAVLRDQSLRHRRRSTNA